MNNYELGVKSELFDRRLLVNASAYYYDYTNLQNLKLVNPDGQIPRYQVTISDVHAWGVDFETHWQATDALRMNSSPPTSIRPTRTTPRPMAPCSMARRPVSRVVTGRRHRLRDP